MQPIACCLTGLMRNIQKQQSHAQDLLNGLTSLQSIDQQDAAQTTALMLLIHSQVTQENGRDQLRTRRPCRGIWRQIRQSDGVRMDGIKAQTGPRFSQQRVVGGHIEPGVAITLLAASRATEKVVLAGTAGVKVLGDVQRWVKGPNPVEHSSGRPHNLLLMQAPGLHQSWTGFLVLIQSSEQLLMLAATQQGLLLAAEQLLGTGVGRHHHES